MALIKCYECSNEVSTDAVNCPKCGASIKKSISNSSPKKPRYLLSAIQLAACGIVIFALSKCDESPSKNVVKGRDVYAAKMAALPREEGSSSNVNGYVEHDIAAFSQFHKDLILFEAPMQAANDSFVRQFNIAKKNGDRLRLYQAATNTLNVYQKMSSDVEKIVVPNLLVATAKEQADKIIPALKNRISSGTNAARMLADMIDNNDMRPSIFTSIQDANGFAAANSMIEASAIFATYTALGSDINQIDIERGGLLPKAAPVARQ